RPRRNCQLLFVPFVCETTGRQTERRRRDAETLCEPERRKDHTEWRDVLDACRCVTAVRCLRLCMELARARLAHAHRTEGDDLGRIDLAAFAEVHPDSAAIIHRFRRSRTHRPQDLLDVFPEGFARGILDEKIAGLLVEHDGQRIAWTRKTLTDRWTRD